VLAAVFLDPEPLLISDSRPFLVLPPAFFCAMTRFSWHKTIAGSADDLR
jgi:hypothetical protein